MRGHWALRLVGFFGDIIRIKFSLNFQHLCEVLSRHFHDTSHHLGDNAAFFWHRREISEDRVRLTDCRLMSFLFAEEHDACFP